ncbi:hypothetical protein RIF29_29516 [Crotalaria pallida]|uniref:Uncharacterized protein n=1 Tax=Crotalaria pallida TaxID=3830 RepID=A0AAN9EEN7_CROPI
MMYSEGQKSILALPLLHTSVPRLSRYQKEGEVLLGMMILHVLQCPSSSMSSSYTTTALEVMTFTALICSNILTPISLRKHTVSGPSLLHLPTLAAVIAVMSFSSIISCLNQTPLTRKRTEAPFMRVLLIILTFAGLISISCPLTTIVVFGK